MSKHMPDGSHEESIVRERVRDMQTEHISFGRLKALKRRAQLQENPVEPKPTKKEKKRSKSPGSPKRR